MVMNHIELQHTRWKDERYKKQVSTALRGQEDVCEMVKRERLE